MSATNPVPTRGGVPKGEAAAAPRPPLSRGWRLALAGTARAGAVLARLRGHRPGAAPRRILVARQARLGDLVVFLPTLAALRARYPEAHITFAVDEDFTSHAFIQHAGLVDEVRLLPPVALRRPAEAGRRIAALLAERYDLLVTGASWFTIREAFLCGAPVRVGIDDGDPIQAHNTHSVPFDASRHEAELNLAAIALAGVEPPTAEARVPRLRLDEPRVAAADARLAQTLDLPADARLLVIHPGAQKPSRRWPTVRFAHVARAVLARHADAHLVLTGTPDERPLAEAVLAALPATLADRVTIAAGRTDLFGLAALLDRAHLFICNDTGVMHVARARGVPLLAVLGPENDLRWGPHPAGRAPATALRPVVPCAPCARWECPALYCLRSLEAEPAAAEALALFDRRADAPSALVTHRTPLDWTALAGAGWTLPPVLVQAPPGALAGWTPDYPAATVAAPTRRQAATAADASAGAGERVAGERVAGERVAGERVAGERPGVAAIVELAAAPVPGALGAAVAALMREPEREAAPLPLVSGATAFLRRTGAWAAAEQAAGANAPTRRPAAGAAALPTAPRPADAATHVPPR